MAHLFFSYLNFLIIYHLPLIDLLAFHFTSSSQSGTESNIGPYLQKGLIGLGAGSATAGCLGAGIGQGFSAGKAAEAIGRNPEAMDKVRTIMIIGAAIAESGAIYSLLVAIILLFVYK